VAPPIFTPQQARRFYDRFGAKLDSQVFYERAALADMAAHMDFDAARSVLEFGCGTGRFAAEILNDVLPPTAHYLGLDISGTMVSLARDRVRPFGPRAMVRQTDGSFHLDGSPGGFDRVIASYVLDLLSEQDIAVLIGEMHRVLEPGGRLGLVGLTTGARGFPRLVSKLWAAIHRLSPRIVGGCRPINMVKFLPRDDWMIQYRNVVSPYAIASEIVVAEKRG